MSRKEIKKIHDIMMLLDGYPISEAQYLLRKTGEFIASTTRFNINATEVQKEFAALESNSSE